MEAADPPGLDMPLLSVWADRTGLLCCKSIEQITLWGCPDMKKVPIVDEVVELSPPPRLKKIKVERQWWESLVQDNSSPFLNLFSTP